MMSVLVSAFEIAKSFGSRTLFQKLTFSISSGQKIGLIGPNGAGKSTLLQILARLQTSDEGQISFANSLRLGYLAQNPEFSKTETVLQTLLNADPDSSESLSLAQELISKLDLDSPEAGSDRLVSELSGGWQKRVALARELMKRPNLLMLDEPTNHLDLPSIVWLEQFLSRENTLAVLMVTHDRLFLQRTCEHIFDLDRRNPDGLIKFDGDYADFVDFKEAQLAALKNLEQSRKNLLRRETEWLRRGAQARQTKQKSRIDRAHDLAEEVADLSQKNFEKTLKVDFGEVDRSPKKMIEAKSISKKIGDRWLFKDFSFILSPQSRVGIIGRNGSGKSTLIRHLIGQDKPDSGSVNVSDKVKISYFEQQRENLDPNVSVLQAISPHGDYVHLQGQPVFARSYLSRFHFRPEQLELPVGKLSGGEQSRLLVARLMLQSESILVLDEPTNDLDINTLDVLQEALSEFKGAVILVTHDRYFMDQVANQILALTENEGEILRFANFFQWEEWAKSNSGKPTLRKAPAPDKPPPKSKGRLSYMEQREFDRMEETILEAESEVERLQKEVAENSTNFALLQTLSVDLENQQKKVVDLYERWQVLNDKGGRS